MSKQIPLSVPNLSNEIVGNLKECIETGWVSTGGRFIEEFEHKVAAYVGVSQAVGLQSGTAGLHLALRALGIGPGDKVIVPTLTFIAAVNPILYVGATPVFIDCDDSLCLDIEKVEEYLSRPDASNVKAVIPVHIFGNLCDMEKLLDLAEEYRFSVIEDATEALGSYYSEGRYKGKFAGTIGDIGVYSFNANKIITTGGGGMVVSRSQERLDKIRYWSTQAKNDILYFVHDEVGYNYRMLNLQAALGVDQISRLEDFIEHKITIYNLYKELLAPIEGLSLMNFNNGIRSNHWFYSLLIDKEKYGISRDSLMHELIAEGIQCRPVWKLIHSQKPYLHYESFKIEKALFYEANILNLPCSTNISQEDVHYVCNKILRLKK